MDRPLLRRFPYTSVVLPLAFMVLVAAIVWDVSDFAVPGIESVGIRRSEINAIVIAFLLVIPAFFIDRAVTRQRAYEAQLVDERLRVLRVTMRTVQDIVNNFLNGLQLLRIEAEGCVPSETLTVFDKSIQDTAAQLTALGNMDVFSEKPMASGPGLDVNPSSASPLTRKA
jgi:hypothetical protein